MDMLGRTIPHYKILEKLGEGGMGVVYKAHDTKLGRTVALKFLPHQITPNESEKARFLQEAKAASALNHPNVCTIYDIKEEGNEQFIVMEFVDGKTLRHIVPIQKFQDAIGYAIQIAEGLQEAHSKGIVHRDIKTDNIMVNEKNQIKILDFGLAKLRGSLRLTKTSSAVGTLAYMAPEQVQGGEVDARSDIFSFGVVLFEMLTGHLPFRGEHDAGVLYSILNEEPEPLQQTMPDSQSELLHILDRALEKDREERYQTVHEMLIDLRRLTRNPSRSVRLSPDDRSAVPRANGPDGKYQGGGASSTPGGINRQSGILMSAGLLVVALLLGGYYLLSRRPAEALPLKRTQVTFAGNVMLTEISPDGKSFAYSDENQRVYIQDIAGGAPLEVFKCSLVIDIRWAPGGTDLAIVEGGGADEGTYVIPRFGGSRRRYAWAAAFVSWSSDGASIVGRMSVDKNLYFLNTSTGLEDSTSGVSLGLQWNCGIDWSPVGRLITIQSADGSYLRRRIQVVASEGSRQGIIVDDSSEVPTINIPPPRWGPRGDAIYYLHGEPPNRDLLRIAVDTSLAWIIHKLPCTDDSRVELLLGVYSGGQFT